MAVSLSGYHFSSGTDGFGVLILIFFPLFFIPMFHSNSLPSFFDLENHVLVDSETKLISDYEVTAASVHDSIPCLDLVPPEPLYEGQEFIADSAYLGSQHNPIQEDLKERKFSLQIIEKGVRDHPLTPLQRFWNRVKSSVRCHIKHVFGEQKNEWVMKRCERLAENVPPSGSECEISSQI
jgi:hypothetical protein